MRDKIENILYDLEQQGWTVQEDFFSLELVSALRQELFKLKNQGALKKAGIGREKSFNIEPSIRSDEIYWLDNNAATPAQKEYLATSSEIKESINQSFYLGLYELETHFALYAPNTFYKRHLDQHKNQDTRVMTVITYLNDTWNSEDGGELIIYLKDGTTVSVLPKAGTFVCFLSAEFEHEVLPAKQDRASLTGWFRKRS